MKNIPSHNGLPDIILGAGVFNYKYTQTPHESKCEDVLRRAFQLGINALDTSAYYGPSEEIVGAALAKLKPEFPRQSYIICTKAGRVGDDEFDYRADSIRKSVERSLQRFNTDYIDILYIHDVEFVEDQMCLEAIAEAFALKKEGKVRQVGISGYPLDYLLKLATLVNSTLDHPLDVVLSYCNLCLQNTRLIEYIARFKTEAHVGQVINASPLSMSLLRSGSTHSFHPAPQILKDKVDEAARYTAQEPHNVEIADLAARFAMRKWAPTVFGLMTVEEVENAVKMYWHAKEDAEMLASDEKLVKGVERILGDTLNLTWPSGIH